MWRKLRGLLLALIAAAALEDFTGIEFYENWILAQRDDLAALSLLRLTQVS